MKQGFPFFAGICGILTPIIALSSIFLSASYSPNFSWTKNWISDLGGIYVFLPIFPFRPEVSTPTTIAILTNGMMLAGILAFIFAVGLWKSIKILSGRVGSLMLMVSAIGIFGTGLFPEPTGMPHVMATFLFFIFGSIGLLYLSAALMDSGQKSLGFLVLLLGIIALLFGGVLIVFRAIPELIASIASSIFTIIFGLKMIKKPPKLIL
jgi:hypothetical membrane protein